MPYKEIIALLWVLVATIAILGLAYWSIRRMNKVGMFRGAVGRAAGEQVKVLARVPVGRNEALVIVQAAGRVLLLGATANSITMLTEFSEAEAALLLAEKEEQRGEQPNFAEVIREHLRQRQKR